MKKHIAIFAILIATATTTQAQKYFTRAGYLGFFSDTKMEDIKGDNNKVNFVLDAATGQLEISGLIKAFEFEKALMQEHFNENYMESDTHPKTSFKGKVDNMAGVNLKKDGTYSSKVTGDLTMHGVTKKITVDATFKVAGGKITCESKFDVVPEDYKITIPGTVRDNIASKIAVTAKANLEELKK
jgi:hypothetical protein